MSSQQPSAASLRRIMGASPILPQAVLDLVTGNTSAAPQPDEVWRVGRDEALIVWVRRIFDDGVADVIPLVLDTDLAESESILLDANATPLGVELAAMVALRTHVHIGAFLNRLCVLDIRDQVDDVMAATREGHAPSGVRVGPPILDGGDQRIEYRQAIRDILSDLTPSAWVESATTDDRSTR